MSRNILVRAEPLKSLAFGDIGVNYVALKDAYNVDQFKHFIRIIRFQNLTDKTLSVSYDGIDEHEKVVAGSFFLFDYATNTLGADNEFFVGYNSRIYVKHEGDAPTLGEVCCSAYYAEGDGLGG